MKKNQRKLPRPARIASKTGSTTTTSASASTSGSSKATTRNKLEIKVPVFSVLRNGCDYKNVVLTTTTTTTTTSASSSNPNPNPNPRGEIRDILVKVGRHPNNCITLDHPSISLHHMAIFVKPSIQKISIVDLTSEQGTWVSGTKIKANKTIEIKEGDVLRLGTSTTKYRLHWLSINEAIETENPLPPIIEEKEEAHQEEICQEVLADQHEITTNGFEHLQRLVRKEISHTGLDSRSVLTETECIEIINRDAASSLFIDLVGTHQQVLPDFECIESVMRGTRAGLASDIAGTSMVSEPVPPESESVRSILRATASSLMCPTSEPAPPASEPVKSVKSISKGTPSSLLSRRSKCKSVSFLSIQTGVTNVKAPQEEQSSNLCEISGAKEVELENEELFESDKENMIPASSHVKSNKVAPKAVNNYSKLATRVLSRKGEKKTAEGKANLNDGSVSSREIRSGDSDKSSSKVLLETENSFSARGNGTMQISFRKSTEKSEETVHILGGEAVKKWQNHDIVEISGREEVERVPFWVLFDNNVQVSSNSPFRPLGTIPDKSATCGPQQQVQREKARKPRKEALTQHDNLLEQLQTVIAARNTASARDESLEAQVQSLMEKLRKQLEVAIEGTSKLESTCESQKLQIESLNERLKDTTVANTELRSLLDASNEKLKLASSSGIEALTRLEIADRTIRELREQLVRAEAWISEGQALSLLLGWGGFGLQ